MPPKDGKPAELREGNLQDALLVEILGRAYEQKLTGRLDLKRGKAKKEIFFLGGMPVHATSRDKSENVIEVTIQRKHLSPDDAHQIRKLQAEKNLPPDQLLKLLGLLTDAELYSLQVETFMQIIVDACGWGDGKYVFREGQDYLENAPIFDLNPLELIYQGIKSHHSLDLASSLQKAEKKRARLRHGWEQTLALPQVYHRRSDVLDLFETERPVGETIPLLYREFGDLNDAMLFLYILMVTGLLEVFEPRPQVDATEKKRTVHKDYALESPPENPGPSGQPAPEGLTTESAPAGEPSPPQTEIMPPVVDTPPPPATPDPTPPTLDDDFEPISWSPPRQPSYLGEESEEMTVENEEPPPRDLQGLEIIDSPNASALDGDTAYVSTRKIRDHVPSTQTGKAREKTRRRAEKEKKRDRLIADTHARLKDLEKTLTESFDFFKHLEVDIETDQEGLRTAWEKKRDRASIDQLPPDKQAEFEPLQRILLDKIDHAYGILTDPEERMAHEQVIFNKRQARATTTELKQKLAIQQWRRGQWYLNSTDRPDLARRCFHQAIELDDTKPQYFAFVGWAIYRKDPERTDLHEALDYLNQSLAINPACEQAHYFLGVIAKRRGDQAAATRHFQEVLRINPTSPQARREAGLIQSRAKQDGILTKIFGKSQSKA